MRCLFCEKELERPGFVQMTGWVRVLPTGRLVRGELRDPKPTGRGACFSCGYMKLAEQLRIPELEQVELEQLDQLERRSS